MAKGYTQIEGLDYHETFSPVAKMVSARNVISVVASKEWDLFHMDVSNAFLQRDLDEVVYMDIPKGFHRQGETRVCKFLKSLYGLKQALRQWNIKLKSALLADNYKQSSYDHSLFTKKQGTSIVVILIYVDDLVITGNNQDLIYEAKQYLHSKFKVKDLGPLTYFLGIEIMRSKHGALLNQRKYALEVISDAGLSGSKLASTPLEANIKLTSVSYDDHLGNLIEDLLLENISAYQRLVGKLIYLTITRLDICFVVLPLSQLMQQPKKSHWDAAIRIVRYLKHSPGLGVFMKKDSKLKLSA